MPRSRIKFHLRLIYVAIFLIALLSFAFNIFLSSSKYLLAKSAEKYFAQKISIQRTIFLPPNFIILKNVSIIEQNAFGVKEVFIFPTILTRFSLSEFLIKRRFSVVDVRLYRFSTDEASFFRFLKDNYRWIIELIRNLPKQNLKFIVNNARVDLSGKNDAGYASFNLAIKIKNKYLLGSGSLVKKSNSTHKAAPLKYNFSGYLMERYFFIEDFVIARKDFYSKLSGEINTDTLLLGGFALIDTLKKEQYETYAPRGQKIKSFINSCIRKVQGKPQIFELPGMNIKIFSINCRINFDLPKIKIERLDFSLDKIPYSLKGEITVSEPLGLNLVLSSFPGKIGGEVLRRADLKVNGNLDKKIFKGESAIYSEFEKNKKPGLHPEKANLEFKNLILLLDRFPKVNMQADVLSLFCQTNNNSYKLFLEDFNSLLNLKDAVTKLVKFSSRIYGGFFWGEAKFRVDKFPPRITSVIRIRDSEANKLDTLLDYFSKIYGNFSSLMYFDNHPHLILEGRLNMQEGKLVDFDFFTWLADFFNLPSVRLVDFTKVSTKFSLKPQESSLDEIELESSDVNLNGYFRVGDNNLVSSKLCLSLSKELMQESPKLTPLVNLLRREDFAAMAFDFQLSGDFEAMNFQWLRSDLKTKLQKLIPDFVERRLQRNIEDAISTITQ